MQFTAKMLRSMRFISVSKKCQSVQFQWQILWTATTFAFNSICNMRLCTIAMHPRQYRVNWIKKNTKNAEIIRKFTNNSNWNENELQSLACEFNLSEKMRSALIFVNHLMLFLFSITEHLRYICNASGSEYNTTTPTTAIASIEWATSAAANTNNYCESSC